MLGQKSNDVYRHWIYRATHNSVHRTKADRRNQLVVGVGPATNMGVACDRNCNCNSGRSCGAHLNLFKESKKEEKEEWKLNGVQIIRRKTLRVTTW